MSRAASRFRKLPPPRVKSQAREPTTTRGAAVVGDLFEHFGVTGDRAAAVPSAIVAADPCSCCGWLCRIDARERVCPLCATPWSTSTDSR